MSTSPSDHSLVNGDWVRWQSHGVTLEGVVWKPYPRPAGPGRIYVALDQENWERYDHAQGLWWMEQYQSGITHPVADEQTDPAQLKAEMDLLWQGYMNVSLKPETLQRLEQRPREYISIQ